MEKKYTEFAEELLAVAEMTATELNHSYVGTGHLLYAMVTCPGGTSWQILIENGFDGTQEWSYEKFGKEPDSLIIKKVSKKSKGDFDLNLNVDKDYKSAKMKVVKNRYYEITFTDPLTKDMPKKTVISIDKNNFYLHEMEMKEGSGKMRITVNHITVGVPDNVFVLDLKKYPTAKVVRK